MNDGKNNRRVKIIVGNWKMNGSLKDASNLAKAIREGLGQVQDVEIAICPPLLHMLTVIEAVEGSTIRVGAQNMFSEMSGAFTGEVSPMMLKEVGVDLVIIGHSERRLWFHETNESVNSKIKAAFKYGLQPILCVGESLDDRSNGRTQIVVEGQLRGALIDVSATEVARLIVAYEPVWAIGTGKTATPDQAVEVHQWIRRQLADGHGVEVSEMVRIQYGGSVTPENSESLLSRPEIDGALVGGASLKAEAFNKIVEVAQACTRFS